MKRIEDISSLSHSLSSLSRSLLLNLCAGGDRQQEITIYRQDTRELGGSVESLPPIPATTQHQQILQQQQRHLTQPTDQDGPILAEPPAPQSTNQPQVTPLEA